MAEEYADVSDDARLLAKKFFPGPLTLILKKKSAFMHGIARGIETIGIRIPDNEFCLSLASSFGRPFSATSANISGQPSFLSVDAILEQFDNSIHTIDLVIDAGELPPSKPSTVVDLSQAESLILREGAIEPSDIWNVLRADV